MGFRTRATIQKSKTRATITAPPAPQIFQPGSGTLTLAAGVPVAGGISARPGSGTLSLVGSTPIIGGVSAFPASATVTATGAAPTISPNLLLGSALVGWYDASQIVGLSDGSSVSQWNDLSGNGHHLVQATGFKQPLYKTGITRGLPAVLFDGSDDFLAASFTLAQPCSVAASFVYVTEDATQRVVTDGHVNNSMLLDNANATNKFRVYDGVALTQTGISKTTWGTGIGVFNGSSSINRFRSIETTGDAGSTSTPGGLTLGARGDGGLSWANIYIGEVVIANTALDSPTRAAIDLYMARWI